MKEPERRVRPGAQTPPGPARRRVRAEILESAPLPGSHHRLTLRASEIAEAAHPGQFLHIWCHPPEEIDRPPCAAILRRPYSISRVRPPAGVEILLRVRGTGGRMLAGKRAGERLDVIGPLGRGFMVDGTVESAVIVAGGIGLAPVPFLVERLAAKGVKVSLLVGAADDEKVPYAVERPRSGRATLPDLAALGAEVSFVSEAVEGILVSELLEARLGELDADRAEVFAIGPRAMLKRLAELTEGRMRLQVSLEERMACGVGACRSCVVPGRAGYKTVWRDGPGYKTVCRDGPGYKTVCRDGPVFDAGEIDWERVEP